MADIQLISKLSKGDAAAQKMFHKTYFGYVMSICIRYLQREDALEACQNVFLKIFKNIKKYDTSKDIKKWMSSITINECIDNIRKNKKRLQSISFEDEKVDNIAHLDVAIHNNSNFEVEYLLKLINSINEANKTVFLLYVVDGYSHKEISQLLDININTSRWRLAEARKEIIPLIKRYYLKSEFESGKYY